MDDAGVFFFSFWSPCQGFRTYLLPSLEIKPHVDQNDLSHPPLTNVGGERAYRSADASGDDVASILKLEA